MEHAAVPGMTREETLESWVNAYSDCLLKTCLLELDARPAGASGGGSITVSFSGRAARA